MSALERQNRPLIGSLMQGLSTPLDASQQSSLASWAVKTAMVLDSVNKRDRSQFYERDECESLRLSLAVPERTTVWVGRYFGSSLGVFGTDVWLDMPDTRRTAKSCATTIVVGHLAVQVLAIHVLLEHAHANITVNPKPGEWGSLLQPVWPVGGRRVEWPPPLSFTNSGWRSIATLMDRCRIGKLAQ